VTVLVDTSAWVEYLRGTRSPHHHWLREAITQQTPVGWTEPILYELTAGARSAARADELRGLLLRGPMLAIGGLRDWEDAAWLYRTARWRGLTVRSTVDCLIAAVAVRTTTPVLARDRDFEALATVSELQLLEP
jgi:predicted nucleic acid-binding protein